MFYLKLLAIYQGVISGNYICTTRLTKLIVLLTYLKLKVTS